MSEYTVVKRSKLLLKGEKPKSKKKKKRKRSETEGEVEVKDTDRIDHGGWGKATNIREINGAVAIEIGSRTYVAALDNGLFTLGPPHDEGEGPSPEEILTAIPVNDSRVAFKSGYGKYLGVSKDGSVTGRSDAIGPLEQWEPVFEDGKMALMSNMSCFMSVKEEDDSIVAVNRSAGSSEMLWVRTQNDNSQEVKLEVPVEERGSLKDIELNYVKKFQKFQDKKIKLCKEDKTQLKSAKEKGTLHEAMLDRRSKMKADRYCK